jgi:sRNA-binding protein
VVVLHLRRVFEDFCTGNWAFRVSSATMSSTHQIERNRGIKDSRQQLAALREKWPLAFPAKHEDIRPLAVGTAGEIAAAVGWSLSYTLGVLAGWKMAPSYYEAVLCYAQRVALDGSPAETIDAVARELATKRLARLTAREIVKPKSDTVPPTATPQQLRARVRASLLRRSAA